eukprot:386615_1
MLLILLFYLNSVHCQHTFDYIVVGSGAGGIVATRLAEQQNKVLLIEAGPDDLTYSCIYDPSTCIASPFGNLIAGTPLIPLKTNWWLNGVTDFKWTDAISMPSFWNYNKTYLNFTNDLLRGKMLGGCLSHNQQVWTRGSVRDFDYIAHKYGLSDWSFPNVLPYFQKLETYFGENKTLRGENGPIHLIDRNIHKWQYAENALINATIQSGLPYNNHQNGDYPQTGIGYSESNNNKYKNNKVGLFNTTYYRASSAQSYVRDIGLSSGYLTIWYNTTVQRIIFDDTHNLSAIGVEYYDSLNNNTLNSVYCSKEVILSAGVYQSPKLLMLSGIGPISELNKFNITPLYINNNIGRYGQDHQWFGIAYKYNISTLNTTIKRPTYNTVRTILNTTQHFDDQFEGELILYASTNTYNRLGYDYNDIKVQIKNWANDIIYAGLEPQIYSKNLTIQLNSSDARDWPNVYLNMFEDSRDYDQIINGLYIVRSIFESNPDIFPEEISPGINYNESNIDQLRKYIYENTGSARHAVGTLSMGPDNEYLYDSPYPVNSRCSLRGVKNLRIVDSSIWPYATNSGDMSLVYMLGEKCAQHIIDDSKLIKTDNDWITYIVIIIVGIIILTLILIYIYKKKTKQNKSIEQDELSLLNIKPKKQIKH